MIEEDTALLPLVVADRICREAARFLDDATPLEHAAALAERAETVYASNQAFKRKLRAVAGRDTLDAFMRHWLTALIKEQSLALYRRLPQSFAVGKPL